MRLHAKPHAGTISYSGLEFLCATVDLRDLKLFLDVAATGSFSRAATLAGSTQSAVSKRIAVLEAQLGAPLFERTGRGAALTDAGRSLRPRAEALTGEAAALADLVQEAHSAPRGTVRVAMQPSVAWPLAGHLLDATRERHPALHLQFSEGTTRQIEEWLADGRIDIGVLSTQPPGTHADSEPLFTLPLLLLARAGHPATRRRRISFASMAKLPLAIATATNGARWLVEEEARRRGIALNIALEVNSFHLIKRLVARDEYVTLAAEPNVAAEIAAGELAAARVVDPELRMTYHLAIGGRRQPGAAVRAEAALIRDLAGPLVSAQLRSRQIPGERSGAR